LGLFTGEVGFAKQGSSSARSAYALKGMRAVCLKYGAFQEAEAKTKISCCLHNSHHCSSFTCAFIDRLGNDMELILLRFSSE